METEEAVEPEKGVIGTDHITFEELPAEKESVEEATPAETPAEEPVAAEEQAAEQTEETGEQTAEETVAEAQPEAKAEGGEATSTSPSPVVDDRLVKFYDEEKKAIDPKKLHEAMDEVQNEIMPMANIGRFAKGILEDPEFVDARIAFWEAAAKKGASVPAAVVEEMKSRQKPAPVVEEKRMSEEEARAHYNKLAQEDETKALDFWTEYRQGPKLKSLEQAEARRAEEAKKREQQTILQQQAQENERRMREEVSAMAKEFPSIVSLDAQGKIIVKDKEVWNEFLANVEGVSPKAPLVKILRMTAKDMGKLTEAKKPAPVAKVAPVPQKPSLGTGKGTVPAKKAAPKGYIASDHLVIN